MTELLKAVGQVVGGVVKAAAPAVVKTTVAPVTRSIPVVATIGREFGAGLSAAKEITPVKIVGAKPLMPFLAKVDMVAMSGDGHRALSMLAFGGVKNDFVEQVAGKLPSSILQHDFITLEKLGPDGVRGLTADIGRMQLPQQMLDDPVFAKDFIDAFGQDVAVKKMQLKNGELTAEEYLLGRRQMVRKSVEKATQGREKSNKVNEKDLEEIKRKAAIDAIRMHMMVWRQSVLKDKRLTPVAKQRALIRIDRFERKLIVQESIKWDGLSVMKMLALAAKYMQKSD